MEEFLRYVIGSIVEFPDDVVISKVESEGKTTFHVAMRKSDLPRLIGRGGHTIQALRSLLQAAASKRGVRVGLEIIE